MLQVSLLLLQLLLLLSLFIIVILYFFITYLFFIFFILTTHPNVFHNKKAVPELKKKSTLELLPRRRIEFPRREIF